MKILANDGISERGLRLLEENGFEVLTTKVAQEQVANYINKNEISVLLVRSATKVNQEIIDSCPSLKVIGRGGVGMDNINVDYAISKGIQIINTPKASAISVAELVFAHLFSGVRFLAEANRHMPLDGDTRFNSLKKDFQNGIELRGKTLGIIGFGVIGQEVAKIAIGLGMNVLASSRTPKTKTISLDFYNGTSVDVTIETQSVDKVLAESDFITIHTPFQQEYIIGDLEFNKMKDGVGIINTSRGGAVDEVALLANFESGKVAFAGLDVFEDEPIPAIQVLMHPQMSLSPHIGGSTVEAQDRIGEELARQIISIII
jgi:D-3-phosphoglycerate dehydrogenase